MNRELKIRSSDVFQIKRIRLNTMKTFFYLLCFVVTWLCIYLQSLKPEHRCGLDYYDIGNYDRRYNSLF